MTSAYASSILRKTLCHASRSKKPQYQTKRADFPKNGNLQKPKPLSFMLILLALLCGGTVAWGQTPTWQVYPSSFTNINEWNYESSGTYKISSPKTIASTINLDGDLTLYPVGVQTINVEKGVDKYALGCKNHSLYIIGTDNGNNKIIFDGGANNRADGFPNPTKVNEGYTKAAIYCNSWGNMWLQNVVFQHFATDAGQNGGNHYCGVINLTNYESNPAVTNTLSGYFKNVEIKECFGGDYKLESLDDSYRYGRIISIIIGKVNLFMDNVNIHHCLIHEDLEKGHFIVNDPISGYGGIIRSQGNSSGKLEMQNCKFRDNQYRDLNAHTPAEYWNNTKKVEDQPLAGQGGAINWRSGASYKNQGNDAWLSPELIIRNCTFERNCAKQGGAIATCCKTTFVKNGTNNYTYISKNHAEYGGGLFFWSYNDGQKTYNGDGFDVTLGGEGFNGNNSAYVRVFDNFALYSGGGAYITIDPSDDVGFEPYPNDAKPKATAYNATFGTGCEIRNNRAPQGAGVTIIDNAAMRHRGYRETTPNLANGGQEANPVLNKWSGILSRTITFDGAIVKDNYTSAQGTFPGSEAAGAGFYIVKQKSKDSNFANDFTTGQHYDTITTLPPGGLMTVNVMSGVIRDNHARQYKLTIGNLNQNDYSPFTDTQETTNPKPGKGGGFYIASLYDIADFKSALNVNIGKVGASDDGLQVFNNDAYTDGGGLYIYYDRDNNRDNGGDVKVLNGYVGKTSSQTNKALNGNGGGLCVLGGTVTVGGGHVLYNTAANGYGGGLYINVPTNNSVTYINASTSDNTIGTNISYNSALDGGGIYVDKGKLKVEGPDFASGAYGQTQAAADNTHTRLTNNEATNGNGGGIDAGNGTVEITNTLFYHNTASGTNSKGRGGGIYLDGGTIEINTSKILYNTANTSGGGICVLSGAVNMKSGDVGNNNAQNNHGGGICVMSGTVKVEGGLVDHNTANQMGGGIYLYGGNLTFTGGTVDQNEASNSDGGGICVEGGNIVVSGGTVSNNEAKLENGGGISVLGGTVLVEGGNILTNTAKELGGGVYVRVPLATTITTIRGGANISSNSAKGGGGVYVDKGKLDVVGNVWNTTTLGWEPLDWPTTDPYDPASEATHTRITNNSATDGNGGGINAGDGTVDITNILIYNNTASGMGDNKGRGGGVYLDGGTIVITDSKILYNTAALNGGGVDNHYGDIDIFGGDISENTATTGNGGGIYTNLGDILVWPTAMKGDPDNVLFSKCKLTKTTVLNNKAGGNGGGLNTHTGRFDVRFAQIINNTAGHNYSTVGTNGGNGGGLFCDGTEHDNGYTVRLLHCHLEKNKAHGLEGDGTGRGGGVYLKRGSIFAEHCDIIENEADINGGGLDNHSGELRVYGSYIDENVAKTGKGGGLYTEEGNIVVGPCDTYGYTASKASSIMKNKAKINGGGINNHKGDITIHGDRINENEAEEGHGGGVYINEGNIFMYGGQINENKADNGKGGGVYGGSGKFNIMERKANPIVEILEVKPITDAGFTVHYHLVDRGKVPIKVTGEDPDFDYEDLNNLTHGVSYIKNGKAWADSSYVEYNSASHRYVLREGCVRIPLTLSASQLYHVKAYAKYSHEGEDYFDASPVLLIATTGDNPVVATGEASEIGKNSAKVTGKLFYKGDNDAGVVTKGIRYSKDGEDSWTNVDSYGSEDEFSVTLAGLDSGTAYQAQAYATNDDDTGYGEIITFTTTTGTGGKAPQGPRSVYPAVEENPFFMELTPLQQAMLANTPEGDTTTAPVTRAKTGRDDPQAQPPEDIPEINENTAMFGGGICIDKKGAELVFSGRRGEVQEDDKLGQINKNFASEAGGGIYIGYQTEGDNIGPAMMQMMGKCEVNYNHVPAGKQGGGIYLDGRLYVGDKKEDLQEVHGLRVDRNFTSDIDQDTWVSYTWNASLTPANSELNNVFLTRYDYDYTANQSAANDDKVSVITLLSDISGYTWTDLNHDGEEDPEEKFPYSHIGFSVIKGFCPVIAISDDFGNDYLNATSESTDNIIPGAYANKDYEEWLNSLMVLAGAGEEGTVDVLKGAVFEDSESYVAVHTRVNRFAPFLSKFIYLWGCWTHPVVRVDPEKNNPMSGLHESGTEEGWLHHYIIRNPEDNVAENTDPLEWEIYSPEGLSWFTSYVNGLNVFDESEGGDADHFKWNENKNPYAIAYIMNDLDMSQYLWVPIGSVKKFYNVASNGGSLFVDSETDPELSGYKDQAHYYRGQFDGQGHIIYGLQGLYLTGIKKYGLFGYLADGAEVKNVFVDDGIFVSDDRTVTYSAGGIAGTLKGGTISNCEARMNFNVSSSEVNTCVGGLAGEVLGGSIHSSMAMPSISGSSMYMGGLVGYLGAGRSLKNSFANVEFLTSPAYNVGGIAGENNGTIENVYVRYRDDDQVSPLTLPDNFYWFVGNNPNQTGGQNSINFCYAPDNQRGKDLSAPKRANNRRGYLPTDLVDNKYGFAHKDQQMVKKSDWSYDTDVNNYADNANGAMVVDSLSGLLRTLNKWVKAANKTSTIYTPWTRTMASKINDDYPVLQIADFNVVGSEDGIYMKYDTCVNRMWETDGKNFNSLTKENNPKAAMYLYNTNYDPISITNNTAVRLHIHENVGITQTDGAELHARVGVTFDNSNKSLALGGKAYDWHMFSSALQNAPMGLTYNSDEGVAPHSTGVYQIKAKYNELQGAMGITHENYTKREYMDPPVTTWNTDAGTIGYFPTNTPYGQWGKGHWPSSGTFSNTEENPYSFDFYCFHEESRHWINFKREGTENFKDHWHQDIDATGTHRNIPYINEENMKVGKGYMMGVSAVSMLMADGILNNGPKTNDVATTGKLYSAEELTNSDYGFNPSGYSEELRGTNLVGNPFQSYLNFDLFAYGPSYDKPSSPNFGLIDGYSYHIFDADKGGYKSYTAGSSYNPVQATCYIHPHQGFFVKTAERSTTLTFDNTMRSTTGNTESYFRNKLNYPLVNLFCYDAEGHYDVTTVEMNRPELGGGSKLKDMRNGNSLIYARMENEDYQTLFAPTGTSTVPVRFEPSQDGVYTMRWGTLHGDFHYLHLVDNMSGADVDMLRSEEYRFEATTSDYISRFKLVFEVTGLEEEDDNEDDNGSSIVNFAFRMGDEIIVNGEGYFELFDVQGRRLTAKHLAGAQSSVSLPNVAAGIYFLRLSDDKQVRTQKMVINY